jgi:hypothetical protein
MLHAPLNALQKGHIQPLHAKQRHVFVIPLNDLVCLNRQDIYEQFTFRFAMLRMLIVVGPAVTVFLLVQTASNGQIRCPQQQYPTLEASGQTRLSKPLSSGFGWKETHYQQ